MPNRSKGQTGGTSLAQQKVSSRQHSSIERQLRWAIITVRPHTIGCHIPDIILE